MKTKIGASTSSTFSSNSCRDGNGNVTLSDDSTTKNVLNFDYVYEHNHELNDYVSNRLISRSCNKIVEVKHDQKEIIKSAMNNLIAWKIITANVAANTLAFFLKKIFFH